MIYLREAAHKTDGDVIPCDVARVVIEDLRALEIHRAGLHRGRGRRHGRLGVHGGSNTIASPNFFAGFVAFCAGVAGMRSLTTAKSRALIDVLISLPTIPAAANVGVAATYRDGCSFRGSLGQRTVYGRRRRSARVACGRTRDSLAPPLSAAAGGRPRTGCHPGR